MATLRTLIPPRRNDAYSFLGTGRWQYQRVRPVVPVGTATTMLEPIDPQPIDGAPVPLRG